VTSFGSLVPNRHASSDSYRYGFQGQEKDDELKGEGNSLNYTFRMHDPRVGRFFTRDPLEKSYPWYTPYQFSGNKVIQFIELEGLEEAPSQAQMNEFMSGKKLDMNNAPSSSPTNAKGFSRNGIWFWKEALKQNPEMFNSSNKWRIENNIAPTVNDQWIKYNPSHVAYKGDKLIHHHIDQGRFAVGIPEKVHRTFFKELHNRASSWFKANKVKSTGNTFMLVFSSVDIIKAADKNPDTMMSTFDPKAPLNTLRGLTPSDPIEWLFNGNSYYEITKKNKDGSFNVNFYAEFYSENGKYRGRNKIEDGVIKKNKDGYIYTPTPEFN
jgi:RHS repeat-associated protein